MEVTAEIRVIDALALEKACAQLKLEHPVLHDRYPTYKDGQSLFVRGYAVFPAKWVKCVVFDIGNGDPAKAKIYAVRGFGPPSSLGSLLLAYATQRLKSILDNNLQLPEIHEETYPTTIYLVVGEQTWQIDCRMVEDTCTLKIITDSDDLEIAQKIITAVGCEVQPTQAVPALVDISAVN